MGNRLTGDMGYSCWAGLCLGTIPPTTDQRLKFVTHANSGRFTISELCEQFAISRKSSHKWLVRSAEGGGKALSDGSRSSPAISAHASVRAL